MKTNCVFGPVLTHSTREEFNKHLLLRVVLNISRSLFPHAANSMPFPVASLDRSTPQTILRITGQEKQPAPLNPGTRSGAQPETCKHILKPTVWSRVGRKRTVMDLMYRAGVGQAAEAFGLLVLPMLHEYLQ